MHQGKIPNRLWVVEIDPSVGRVNPLSVEAFCSVVIVIASSDEISQINASDC